MKTLDEHNKDVIIEWASKLPKYPANVSCPNCKEELEIEQYSIILTRPEQIRVHCRNCGFRGQKFINETSYI